MPLFLMDCFAAIKLRIAQKSIDIKKHRMARTRSQTAKSGKSLRALSGAGAEVKFKECNCDTMTLQQCRKSRSSKVVKSKDGRWKCKCNNC